MLACFLQVSLFFCYMLTSLVRIYFCLIPGSQCFFAASCWCPASHEVAKWFRDEKASSSDLQFDIIHQSVMWWRCQFYFVGLSLTGNMSKIQSYCSPIIEQQYQTKLYITILLSCICCQQYNIVLIDRSSTFFTNYPCRLLWSKCSMQVLCDSAWLPPSVGPLHYVRLETFRLLKRAMRSKSHCRFRFCQGPNLLFGNDLINTLWII